MTIRFEQDNAVVRNDADITGNPAVLVTGKNITVRNAGYLDGTATGTVIALVGAGSTVINEAAGNVGSDFFRSAITGSDYADTIIDYGHIRGRVELGGGDDVYIARKSSADVSFGDGNDRFSFEAGENYMEMYNLSLRLNGGAGIDTLDLSGTGLKLSPIVRDFEVLNVTSALAYLNSLSGFNTITLAPNGYYEFAYSSNPNVDLDLRASLSLRATSSLRSVTGSEGQEELSISGDVRITNGVQLGAGIDFVTIIFGQDKGVPQIGNLVDGGTGADQLSFVNEGDDSRTIDLTGFRSFESIEARAVGGFEFLGSSDASTLRLSADAKFTFDLQASRLDIATSSGSLHVAADSVIGSITGPGGYSSVLTTSNLSVVNDGRIVGDVRLSDANDLYSASGVAGGTVYGFGGDDLISGGAASDRLDGGTGNDIIRPGGGRDVIDGGDGSDILDITAGQSAVSIAQADGHVVLVTEDGAVRVTAVEQVRFGNGVTLTWANVAASTAAFDALSYIASYGDLRAAYGTQAAAGEQHFVRFGFAEGRGIAFNALEYIASYSDLRNAFGIDASAGLQHFIKLGAAENRSVAFDGWTYLASNGDLIRAYGANETAALQHFIRFGAAEGRVADFDALAYAAANADLAAMFGTDREALARHYVQWGYAEGRSPGSGAASSLVTGANASMDADSLVSLPAGAFVSDTTHHSDALASSGEAWNDATSVAPIDHPVFAIA